VWYFSATRLLPNAWSTSKGGIDDSPFEVPALLCVNS
jgi:hypothetical protein